MEINLIALAIPVFFAMIGVELLVAWLMKRRVYRLNDAITDLSCGIGSQVTGVFMKAALFAVYILVYETWHLIEWTTASPLAWIVALFGVDFGYYWWHRASHRINVFWAAHIVHHHSQDYNLAVALRQAWFTRITSVVFYLPLAVLGVPPIVFGAMDAINTLYQFWIHTRTVGKLGPIEWVMNTPSHHRVHHGINPEYIDKNYAGIFIIWDRLFGTFEEEQAEVVYGTVKVYESWDPVWANFHYWYDMARVAWHAPRLRDKLLVWLAPPEWTPAGDKVIPPVDARTFRKWDVPKRGATGWYVLAHFVPVTFAVVWMLAVEKTASWSDLALVAALVVWTTWAWSALFEGRPYALAVEWARLGAVAAAAAALTWGTEWFLPATVVTATIAAGSAAWVYVARPVLRLSPTDA